MSIKKWAIIGVLYLLLVVITYSVMTEQNPIKQNQMEHNQHNSSEKIIK